MPVQSIEVNKSVKSRFWWSLHSGDVFPLAMSMIRLCLRFGCHSKIGYNSSHTVMFGRVVKGKAIRISSRLHCRVWVHTYQWKQVCCYNHWQNLEDYDMACSTENISRAYASADISQCYSECLSVFIELIIYT